MHSLLRFQEWVFGSIDSVELLSTLNTKNRLRVVNSWCKRPISCTKFVLYYSEVEIRQAHLKERCIVTISTSKLNIDNDLAYMAPRPEHPYSQPDPGITL
jgi:hypothetical protein